MNDLIAKLEAATEGSRELDEAIHEAIYNKPPYLTGWGKAPGKGPYGIDLSVCDMCGAPATTTLDLSIQLPDYRGVCEEHARLAKENQSAWYAYYRIPILHYTTSLDAAMTLVPEGLLWAVERNPVSVQWWGSVYDAMEDLTNSVAATPALALCIAALKAREASK